MNFSSFLNFLQSPEYLFYNFTALLSGLAIGSFVANTGYRLAGYFFGHLSQRQKSLYSIFFEKSRCDKCNEKIGYRNLIPVFSWLFLKGKCAHCNGKISGFYPVIESIWGVMGIFLAYLLFISVISRPILLYILIILIIVCLLAIIDKLKFHIPDSLIILLFLLTFPVWLMNLFHLNTNPGQALLLIFDSRGGGVILAIPFLIVYLLAPKKIGFGDIKYVFAFSLVLTLKEALLMIQFSSLFGILFVLLQSIRTGKPIRKIRIPLVTFLTLGAIISYPFIGFFLNKFFPAVVGIP